MFGKRLAELRNKKGISQYELADRLKFSRGQIANYEQGTREPDFITLISLADYFDISLDYLLGRTDTPLGLGERLTAEEIEYLKENLTTFRRLKEKWSQDERK